MLTVIDCIILYSIIVFMLFFDFSPYKNTILFVQYSSTHYKNAILYDNNIVTLSMISQISKK